MIGCIKDQLVGEELLVEYMLSHFAMRGNKGKQKIVNGLGIEDPFPDWDSPSSPFPWELDSFVDAIARKSGAAGKVGDARTAIACRYILREFRTGKMGRVNLDHQK